MDYILMNKNTPLLEVAFEDGDLTTVGKLLNMQLMPMCFPRNGQGINKKVLKNWWKGRQIPASRDGIKDLMWAINKRTDINPIPEMTEKMLGFSLSDQYWINPVGENITWSDVNFFTNSFSEDIGKLLTGQDVKGHINIASPDNTADGVLKKRWKIIDGKRCLLKGYGSVDRKAEPFREVLASRFLETLLPEDHVTYTLLKSDSGYIYSCCENFITVDTEYVNCNQINDGFKRRNEVSLYNHIKQFCSGKEYIFDLMFILDFIVVNTDRHFGNFGFIRDVNSGDLLNPAPVFDTGSSLYYDAATFPTYSVASKPFKDLWVDQIKMFDCANYQDVLHLLSKKTDSIFNEVFTTSPESSAQKQLYLSSINARIKFLLNNTKGSTIKDKLKAALV